MDMKTPKPPIQQIMYAMIPNERIEKYAAINPRRTPKAATQPDAKAGNNLLLFSFGRNLSSFIWWIHFPWHLTLPARAREARPACEAGGVPGLVMHLQTPF